MGPCWWPLRILLSAHCPPPTWSGLASWGLTWARPRRGASVCRLWDSASGTGEPTVHQRCPRERPHTSEGPTAAPGRLAGAGVSQARKFLQQELSAGRGSSGEPPCRHLLGEGVPGAGSAPGPVWPCQAGDHWSARGWGKLPQGGGTWEEDPLGGSTGGGCLPRGPSKGQLVSPTPESPRFPCAPERENVTECSLGSGGQGWGAGRLDPFYILPVSRAQPWAAGAETLDPVTP